MSEVLLLAPVVVPLLAAPDRVPVVVLQQATTYGQESRAAAQHTFVSGHKTHVTKNVRDYRRSLPQVVIFLRNEVQTRHVCLLVCPLKKFLGMKQTYVDSEKI